MPSLLLTVFELSAALTVSSLCAFALRRVFLRGREREMSAVWLCILVISLLPVRIGKPLFYLYSANKSESIAMRETEYVDNYAADPASYGRTGQNDASYSSYSVGSASPAPVNVPQAEAVDAGMYVCAALTAVWSLGATLTLARSVSASREVRRTLECCSRDPGYGDRALVHLFEHCKKLTGVKNARLRIYGGGFDCSPYAAGVLRPTVYIGADAAKRGVTECEYILSHELYHIKYNDVAAKLLIAVAAAFHWFNPSARRVADAYAEDCEYRADAGVLRLFGDGARARYMNTILDAAERMGTPAFAETAPAGSGAVSALSFERLERRYVNMKHTKTSTIIKAALAAFVAVSFCASALLLSSCAVASAADTNPSALSPSVEEAVRAYYKIGTDDAITDDMINGVTSLHIGKNAYTDSIAPEGETLVDVFVNDSIYGGSLECVVGKERFESMVPLLSDKTGSAAIDETASRASIRDYILAFYVLKDPSDASLDASDVADMYAVYPATRDGAIYLLDPYTKPREAEKLYNLVMISGLLDDKLIAGGEFDAACFAELPNLETVTVSGVTLVNEPETNSYTVTYEPEREATGSVYDTIHNQALLAELLFREESFAEDTAGTTGIANP